MLSVLNQDYPALEYIVVDGGSTDGSVDIIRKYEKRLAWWVSEPDQGQSDAINKGFAHANGEIYNWLNSDDVMCPGAVRIAVHFLNKYPEYQMVFGDRLVIDAMTRIIDVYEAPSYSGLFPPMLAKLPQEGVFFTADLWRKVNGLNRDLHYVMDTDLWYRFSKETGFFHIPAFMGKYREHEKSKSVYGMGSHARLNERATIEIAWRDRKYGNFLTVKPGFKRFMGFLNQVRLAYEKSRRSRRLLRKEACHYGFEN